MSKNSNQDCEREANAMRTSSVWGCLAVLSVLLAVCVPPAAGQAVFGSVFGTVTDPSGAAVPNAKVTVTN